MSSALSNYYKLLISKLASNMNSNIRNKTRNCAIISALCMTIAISSHELARAENQAATAGYQQTANLAKSLVEDVAMYASYKKAELRLPFNVGKILIPEPIAQMAEVLLRCFELNGLWYAISQICNILKDLETKNAAVDNNSKENIEKLLKAINETNNRYAACMKMWHHLALTKKTIDYTKLTQEQQKYMQYILYYCKAANFNEAARYIESLISTLSDEEINAMLSAESTAMQEKEKQLDDKDIFLQFKQFTDLCPVS